jgi:hypothetical protein
MNSNSKEVMEKIIMPRGTGKTHQLIIKSADTGDYIVCHSIDEALRIQHESNKLGVKIPLPITYNEFIKNEYYAKGIKGFLIDNVEKLLQSLTEVPIKAITLNP